jgi:hypothetical protein
MTAAPTSVAPDRLRAADRRSVLRLARLHATSRRLPAGLAVIAVCAAGLRIALIRPWDDYGALQLPLVFETASAAAIAVTTASPFGEPERAVGWRLPALRLTAVLGLTAAAVALLAVAGGSAHVAGGSLDVLRNVAGLTGIGLLCAAVLGGALAWLAQMAYLLVALYALYTQWHGPALTTPWLWPARPPHDAGAALCAGLVFAAGLVIIMVRGARDTG